MNLLIVTQKIDREDDVLGFFHSWLDEFSKRSSNITAICLFHGNSQLSKNVNVLSLGKEGGRSRLKYTFRFFKYIFSERKKYDAVLVHMNPEYVLLGGILWKLMGKKITLWYAHGKVTKSLIIAEKVVDIIFTSVTYACRLKSPKLRIVGQGIDVDRIKPQHKDHFQHAFSIITIGRISPSKDYDTLITAASILKKEGYSVQVNIVGDVGTKGQENYFKRLKNRVKGEELSGFIKFIGPVPYKDIIPYLRESNIFASMTHTGSLDKAVLEAMSAGLPVVTCGEAFDAVFGEYAEFSMYPKKDAETLAKKIAYFINLDKEKRDKYGKKMREIVVKEHSLASFVNKVMMEIKK